MDGERLPDEVVRRMTALRLSDVTGKPWQVEGSLVKGPGSVAVMLGENHSDHPGHFDLDFVFNVKRPADTTISDCVVGYGATAEQVADRAIQIWLETTGSALLELLAQDGSLATHMASDHPEGFPGWHVIHGGIIGWGTGENLETVQRWAVGNLLLPRLAPVLSGGFERDYLIGIKAFFGGGEGTETAEIRVNGVHHEAASQVLAGLEWPRPTDGMSYARTFILLVGNETV
ncbi:DUF6348 family protein [Acrocarpospora catenulata]|uniref:DUF6348 family protein n=1 Tax=Acrocarpospora catenulata TaxID=2836182 RepID=UPI001BDA9BDD|nr:DUF6348 family protein [Acrocarpospora catenulata]